jgi:hypothetical protein
MDPNIGTAEERTVTPHKGVRTKGKLTTSTVNIKRIPPGYVEELVSVPTCPIDVQTESSVERSLQRKTWTVRKVDFEKVSLDKLTPTQQYGVLVLKNAPVVWVEMEDDLGTDENVVPVTRHPQVKVIWKGLTPTQQHTVKTQCGSEPV